MPRFHIGHAALLLTAALFGIAFIFQRHSATAVSALTFMSWRLPVSAAFLLATLLAFAGLTCFAAIHSDSAALNWNAGDSATLASAIIWALYVNYYGITVRRSDLLALTTVQISTAALLSLPLTLALEGAGALTDPALLNHSKWDILYTAVASSGIAFFLQGWAQRHVAATPTAIILSMESIFALAAGWLILDEPVTLLMLTGCALLFAAMTIAQLEPGKTP